MRRFLSPKWIAGHALAIAAIGTCLFLAWWQWGRANQVTGTFQNLGYALQWPLFAAFFAYGWWKIIRIEIARTREPVAQEELPAANEPERVGRAVPRYAPPSEPDDTDDELAAYNRRLAQLNGLSPQSEPTDK